MTSRWLKACFIFALGLGLTAPSVRAQTTCKITILGDSLTAAYGLPMEEGFPARLEQALAEQGLACEVLDAGVSGDTSAGGLARLDWVLADQPTHMIVELGGNDALRGLPPEDLEANLDAIVAGAQEQGVHVFVAGMLAPRNLGTAYGDAFAGAFERVSAKYDVPLYPFFLEGVALDQSYMQRDGIHPNASGVREIVSRILPRIAEWLEETGLESEG